MTCSIDGCDRVAKCRTWCGMHYHRWQRYGDPLVAIAPQGTPEDRFWPKVDKSADGGCWVWTGTLTRGYGLFNAGANRFVYAHRFSYELLVGPIPDGLQIDHLCRNPKCCNPSHLEAVPARENTSRARRIGHDHPNAPTTCKRGHDWTVTPPYLAHRSDGRVSRRCRVCQSDRERAKRAWVTEHPAEAVAMGTSELRVGVA